MNKTTTVKKLKDHRWMVIRELDGACLVLTRREWLSVLKRILNETSD